MVVEPLTNYNILVLDQRFNQNSSVALVNTNVTRNGEFRDANVSALVYDLNTKNNKFNLTGDFKYSYINEYGDNDNLNGINTAIQIGKKEENGDIIPELHMFPKSMTPTTSASLLLIISIRVMSTWAIGF